MVSSLGAPGTSGASTIVFKSCLYSKNILESFIQCDYLDMDPRFNSVALDYYAK